MTRGVNSHPPFRRRARVRIGKAVFLTEEGERSRDLVITDVHVPEMSGLDLEPGLEA
jgi:FixJ family two-component response regulator